MRKLIYYIFYRTSKFYREWSMMGDDIHSVAVLVFALSTNTLSLIGFLCFILKTQYSLKVAFGVAFLIAILCLFTLNEKKYKKLEKIYKNEKNSKLKEWLVFAYIIGSFILYSVSLCFML